jgi:hypothetical protein
LKIVCWVRGEAGSGHIKFIALDRLRRASNNTSSSKGLRKTFSAPHTSAIDVAASIVILGPPPVMANTRIRLRFANTLDKPKSVETGHPEVRDHSVECSAQQTFQRLVSVLRERHVVIVRGQGSSKRFAHSLNIVNNQNIHWHSHSSANSQLSSLRLPSVD